MDQRGKTPEWHKKKKSRRGQVVSLVCVVFLSGRGLFDGLVTRLEESADCCVFKVCDHETSKNEEA
jgi:hypothetical protein